MKDKICLICHTAIDTDKEFCEFKHYKNKDEIKSKAYYHIQCFMNRLNGGNTQRVLANKTMELLDKVGGLVD